MALAYRIYSPDDFGRVFACHDQFSTFLNDLFGRTLTPDDDHYAAPFCFLPDTVKDVGGYIVFTCRVPWLHGHGHVPGLHRNKSDWREQNFHEARQMVKEECMCDPDDLPFLEPGVERMQRFLGIGERWVSTFTEDGCYPAKEDIAPALEDRAVEATCEAMGWPVPDDWREARERERAKRVVYDVYNVARGATNTPKKDEEGSDSKRMKYSEERPCATRISSSSRAGGEHEETKEAKHPPLHHYAHSVSRESGEHDGARDSYYGHTGGVQMRYSFESGDTHGDSFYDEENTYAYDDDLDDSEDLGYYGPQVPPPLGEDSGQQRLDARVGAYLEGVANVVENAQDEGPTEYSI